MIDIFLREFMSTNAMRLPTVLIRNRKAMRRERIFFWSLLLQMRRIHTRPIPAEMVNMKSRQQRGNKELV